MRAFGTFAFLGLAVVVVGCNLVMNLGRFNEPATPDSGGGPGAGEDAGPGTNFDCLKQPNEALDPSPVTLHLLVTNATTPATTAGAIDGGSDIVPVVYDPEPGVTFVSCLELDPLCAHPVTSPQTSDDAGFVTLSLTGSFSGFFRGTGPTVVPFTFAPGQWLTGAKEATYLTSALAPSDEQLLNGALGNAVDLDAGSGLGEVFIIIYDCDDHHVPGATIALSRTGPETLPFYIVSGLPSTTVQVTDSEGVGGAVNVPSGTVRATATYLATSTTLGSVDVYVRPGELTYGWIRMRVH
jgi:hypothetical protein